MLTSLDPLYAPLVIAVLVAALSDLAAPRRRTRHAAMARDLRSQARAPAMGRVAHRPWSLAMSAIVLLAILNSGWFARHAEDAPIIYRAAAASPMAQRLRLLLRHRAGAASAASWPGLFNFDRFSGGAGVALLMSGLAVVVATGDLLYLRRQCVLRSVWASQLRRPPLGALAATLFFSWISATEAPISLPARTRCAHFFGDN